MYADVCVKASGRVWERRAPLDTERLCDHEHLMEKSDSQIPPSETLAVML